MYILHWASYDEISTDLDSAIVGTYNSLAEAQYNLQENIEETIGYYENDTYSVEEEFNKTTFSNENGYVIFYAITEI